MSKNSKPFKYFKKTMNNNLPFLSSYLLDSYKVLEERYLINPENYGMVDELGKKMWEDSKSISTVMWKDYNIFSYQNIAIYDLYKTIGDLTKEACEYYEINFYKQRYMIQGWFNINNRKSGKLDWHQHSEIGAPNFHGYYCVNAEPTNTHYRLENNEELIINNTNNTAILAETSRPHAMGDWSWDGDRITIAYDVSPISHLRYGPTNHWIPL